MRFMDPPSAFRLTSGCESLGALGVTTMDLLFIPKKVCDPDGVEELHKLSSLLNGFLSK